MNFNETDLRTLFLKEFVRHLILESTPLNQSDYLIIPTEEELEKESKTEINLPLVPEKHIPIVKPAFIPEQEQKAMEQRRQAQKKPQTPIMKLKPTKLQQRPQNIRQRPQMAQVNQKPLEVGLPHSLFTITYIMQDPSVITVECPGSGKNLLVNRNGTITPSPISLNGDEVREIIYEISAITKIPVVPGVFKAAFDNYIATAVVSDFVGTRFLIQKKPFIPLPPIQGYPPNPGPEYGYRY